MDELDLDFEDNEETETFEAKDYFADLKTKVNKIDAEKLEAAKAVIAQEIEKATSLGQKNLAHRSSYMWTIIEREFALHALGYVDYVLVDDVTRFIDNVKPKNSVKAVELSRFPRVVPAENAEEIKKALDLKIFDQFVVIYTDFTGEQVSTPEEKAMVARNTDPVVFGMFRNDKLDMNHNRLYLITDWEDEFCDLTFNRLVDKMAEMGMKNPAKKLTGDVDHINRMAAEALSELEESNNVTNHVIVSNNVPYKKSFFSKVVDWFKR